MKTQQPIWKFLGNLGDATPIDYGGFFVYEDTTGVYAPQAELLETPEEHVLERDERRKDKLERELRDQFESQNPEATEEQIEEYIKTNLVFEPEARWTVRRFDLDKCTYDAENDILSDNKFHPDHAAWFAKPERERAERPQDTTYLEDIAQTMGAPKEKLIELFCSDNPLERAQAYRMVGDHHGFDNLDEYPLQFTRAEIEARYQEELK